MHIEVENANVHGGIIVSAMICQFVGRDVCLH